MEIHTISAVNVDLHGFPSCIADHVDHMHFPSDHHVVSCRPPMHFFSNYGLCWYKQIIMKKIRDLEFSNVVHTCRHCCCMGKIRWKKIWLALWTLFNDLWTLTGVVRVSNWMKNRISCWRVKDLVWLTCARSGAILVRFWGDFGADLGAVSALPMLWNHQISKRSYILVLTNILAKPKEVAKTLKTAHLLQIHRWSVTRGRSDEDLLISYSNWGYEMHLRDLKLNSMEPGRPINGDSVRCWSNSIDELVLPPSIQKIWQSEDLRICQSYLMFNLLETYQIASGIHWLNPLARNRGSTNLERLDPIRHWFHRESYA